MADKRTEIQRKRELCAFLKSKLEVEKLAKLRAIQHSHDIGRREHSNDRWFGSIDFNRR